MESKKALVVFLCCPVISWAILGNPVIRDIVIQVMEDPVRPSAIKITGRGPSSSGNSVQPPEGRKNAMILTEKTTAIVKIHRLARDDDPREFILLWAVGKRFIVDM